MKKANDDGNEGKEVDILKIKKWMNVNDNTVIGKMTRFLYATNTPISIKDFKNGINYIKSDDEFKSCLRGGSCVAGNYGKMWTYTSDYNNICLTDATRKIINHL
jgi:hypothetical protein